MPHHQQNFTPTVQLMSNLFSHTKHTVLILAVIHAGHSIRHIFRFLKIKHHNYKKKQKNKVHQICGTTVEKSDLQQALQKKVPVRAITKNNTFLSEHMYLYFSFILILQERRILQHWRCAQ
ncbi:hypothetical protein GOODEAATRI_033610 [Goodea atripinnis]|uniref:Uncharacterized protein n=1 Tax=Goodea atripinnis TaxID=208336 RepID=A0ABV0NST4_9TELE